MAKGSGNTGKVQSTRTTITQTGDPNKNYLKQTYKISFIIPTMWFNSRIFSLIERLEALPNCDEILIIDNFPSNKNGDNLVRLNYSPTKYNSRFEWKDIKKVRILEQKENIYVNPAWNLGVKEARNDLICLLNDDVYIDLYEVVMNKITPAHFRGLGIMGMNPFCYMKDEWRKQEDVATLDFFVGHGFGCCMFLHKDHYYPIPDDLKIWFGDNWLFLKNQEAGLKNAVIGNHWIDSDMSCTVTHINKKDPSVIQKEIEWWASYTEGEPETSTIARG